MKRFPKHAVTRPSIVESVLVGGAAGTAYAAAMLLDMRITRNKYDDFVLWGGFVTPVPWKQRVLGAGLHYILSVAVAALFLSLTPLLPRIPRWLQGLLFVQVENAVLYPGVPLIDRIHPEVRAGRMPTLRTWKYFWLEIARHAAFGTVLGIAAQRRRRP